MPHFAFVAKDRLGNTINGQVEADSVALAANQIGQMGYALIDLQAVAAAPGDRTAAMPAARPDPTRVFAPLPVSADATVAFTPPANVSRLAAAPTNKAVAPAPQATPAGAETPKPVVDILQADREKRQKVEADLAKMGMRPDEIRRLLDANATTTEVKDTALLAGPPPALPARPAPKQAHQKLAAKSSDLQNFAAQLQAANAAKRAAEVKEVALDLPDFRPSTLQERQQAEAILREVYALRKRERYTEAIAKCREALGLIPSDAAALEMFGDLLQGVARTPEALAAYRRSVDADPNRASAERKYGDLLARQERFTDRDLDQPPRSPVASAVFSLLIPGAGQIHNGERTKGAVLVAFAAASVAILLALTQGKTGYKPSWELSPAARIPKNGKREPLRVDWAAHMPAYACVLFYLTLGIGSAFDAAAVARKQRA